MHTLSGWARRERSAAKAAGSLLADAARWARHLPFALFDTLLSWQERASQRHALRRLDDRMLRDIGLSRADIARECAKPFWRP